MTFSYKDKMARRRAACCAGRTALALLAK